eukprot:768633-Hanusia_phi.AAC.8
MMLVPAWAEPRTVLTASTFWLRTETRTDGAWAGPRETRGRPGWRRPGPELRLRRNSKPPPPGPGPGAKGDPAAVSTAATNNGSR